ncbi:hypothetical protein BDZ91DRAFT_748630 [Kalaharituber pfeilii]|nr:hypothetical protein BDZ91DRAFT_748630 [Kalaharituber pfeilii]
MYLEEIGVYPGCDGGQISPTAVGAIVAIVIVGFCGLGGLCLWGVRRRLYRNPIVATGGRKGVSGYIAPTKGKDVADESEIGTISARDGSSIKSPKPAHVSKVKSGIRWDGSRSQGQEVYEMGSGRGKSNLFTPQRRNDGDFDAVHLDSQLAARVLDFTGITVTREIQVICEHDSAHERDNISKAGR